ATVYQLGRGSQKASTDASGSSNAVLKEYEFVDIFPTAISAIAKKVKLAEDLFNMPPSSKLLLKILEYEGSMSQKELVKKTMLPDRTVRLAMSHLLEKGYVKKKISIRDSRQKIYEISKLINSDLQQ
ncbi:MAG: hypothetical protein QGH95_03010, partial [Candidatus Nitrosopelagicus sp.]|nr:hypothetical protein [Candidatus Nitrosopelagicus sp.]